jgi:hypothetical protein
MSILIDGYNLLHVSGIFGRARGADGLRRSREALLRTLAASLPADERPRTTVVFDAAEAPPGLPRTVDQDGMTIRYASDHAEADDLIEELIAADHAPKKLVVVSSDHRIQRAARRRKAQAVDSDRWFQELQAQRASRAQADASPTAKPQHDPTEAEVQFWMERFAVEEPPEDISPDSPFPPGYGEDLLEGM